MEGKRAATEQICSTPSDASDNLASPQRSVRTESKSESRTLKETLAVRLGTLIGGDSAGKDVDARAVQRDSRCLEDKVSDIGVSL